MKIIMLHIKMPSLFFTKIIINLLKKTQIVCSVLSSPCIRHLDVSYLSHGQKILAINLVPIDIMSRSQICPTRTETG